MARCVCLGFGWQKGRGLNSGDITDLEAAEKAIRACVGQAEDMADTRLRAVTVNLTCGQPESRLFNVQWPVGGRAVTENDIRGVLNEGRGRAEVDGREPIHVLPLNFAVDATDHVIDPRGLFCSTLNARLHVIDAAATALRTLESCINRCDLEIEDLVSAPMAAGLSSLVPEERELGATIIDMGGGTTSMAVYADKQMMHTAQLPIGGSACHQGPGDRPVDDPGACGTIEDAVRQCGIQSRTMSVSCCRCRWSARKTISLRKCRAAWW